MKINTFFSRPKREYFYWLKNIFVIFRYLDILLFNILNRKIILFFFLLEWRDFLRNLDANVKDDECHNSFVPRIQKGS